MAKVDMQDYKAYILCILWTMNHTARLLKKNMDQQTQITVTFLGLVNDK